MPCNLCKNLILSLVLNVVMGNEREALVVNEKLFEPDALVQKEGGAMGKSDSYWPNPDGVSVCWETAGWSREKDLVRVAVAETWEKHSALRFIGWNQCTNESTDIRILIEDGHPHVKTLGNNLRNLTNGMLLNFEYRSWGSGCRSTQHQQDECTWSIAIHEFGHAIGLAHEQNRPDVPDWCRGRYQDNRAEDHLITTYDAQSVMNYCSTEYINGGQLTELDKQAVRLIYPPATCVDRGRMCRVYASGCLAQLRQRFLADFLKRNCKARCGLC